MNIKGVITGDIVQSRAIVPALRQELIDSITHIAADLQNFSQLKIEIFRGDSFQILVEDPLQALKIAVLFRAGLRAETPEGHKGKWDARLAVGIGEEEYTANNIVTSDGPAFRNSGWEFDNLGKRRLALRTPWPEVNNEFKVSTAFADAIITDWTAKQAAPISRSMLYSLNQKETALILGYTGQNISQLMNAGKESLIRMYLDRYEQVMGAKIQ